MAKKSKLELLLSVKPIENTEIYPSQRFKDAGATVTIKPIDESDFKDAQAMSTGKDGEMDELKMALLIVEKALVEPSVDEIREATTAFSNEAAIKNMFNLGERAKISEQILKLSGFDSFDAQVDEAKK